MIGSTKNWKFVAICFHKFCVIYFVYIVFDTKPKKQEGSGRGCASIFHVIIFNTKTILFANTDGDQWKSWIMSMWELVVSFSGVQLICGPISVFQFFGKCGTKLRMAVVLVVPYHTIPYHTNVATWACPQGTGTAGGTNIKNQYIMMNFWSKLDLCLSCALKPLWRGFPPYLPKIQKGWWKQILFHHHIRKCAGYLWFLMILVFFWYGGKPRQQHCCWRNMPFGLARFSGKYYDRPYSAPSTQSER